MANFHTVPVIDVHNDNFRQLWPTMMLALKSATFVALDLEMSGLGNRRLLMAKSIEDRYNIMGEVAKTRSVVSLGISCFKLQPALSQVASSGTMSQEASTDEGIGQKVIQDGKSVPEIKTNLHFFVQTFNIVLLCKDSYMVEPESLRFLVQHGFDFNKQYAMGISYHPGIDKPDDGKQNIRELLNEIIVNKVPVALHNGLVDLVFLYHAFYSTVPSKLSQFVSDLSEIFSGGVYDTKYIAEYEVRLASSYLEYAFRKSQKDNLQKYHSNAAYLEMSFPQYPDAFKHIEYRECGLPDSEKDFTTFKICEQFGAFGWCKLADNCPKSHDIDAILNVDDNHAARKRRKRGKSQKQKQQKTLGSSPAEHKEGDNSSDDDMDTMENTPGAVTMVTGTGAANVSDTSDNQTVVSSCVNQETNPESNSEDQPSKTVNGLETRSMQNGDKVAKTRCTGHRAGFDAFMTGYTLAAAVLKCGKQPSLEMATPVAKLSDFHLEKLKNNVYLSGKDMPLKITKSNFSKSSREHRIKYARLMSPQESAMVT